ncbi:MAG: DNA-processing protein DprA [Vicinamibacterales bacterium]
MSPRLDLIALSLLPVWRWRAVAEQLRNGEPASDILHAHGADAARQRRRPEWADPARAMALARRAVDRAAAAGLIGIAYDDLRFPALLGEIVDPPPMLWVAGHVDVLATPAVAIVGSRAGSAYALGVAERLAADLAARGVTIVSGLARGVDSAAHRGALAAGGTTIGVLGSGADVNVSAGAHGAGRRDARGGAIVSELVPGTDAASHVLPDAQPYHQRSLACRRGGGSGREERVADHSAICARTGARRAGGTGQRAERAQSRWTLAPAGRSQARRDRGRCVR